MNVATTKRKPVEEGGAVFDRELGDLPQELRWREWMGRIEAVLFASGSPVGRDDLARVVGQAASVELLIEDLALDLAERPYEIARVADGWMLRSRPSYAAVNRAAADVADQAVELTEFEGAGLAAVAYRQPGTRDGLRALAQYRDTDRLHIALGRV